MTIRVPDDVRAAIITLATYEDDKIRIKRYETHDGPNGYRVTLADGREVYNWSDWGGGEVHCFHPGAWCDYIKPIYAKVAQERKEREAAEEAAERAAETAKFAPVDDSALFGGAVADDEPNPERFYRWLCEIEVNETWVADGFNLTDDRLKEMVASDLTMAHSVEFRARVFHAPPEDSVARAQGYSNAEEMHASK
jgi:hypothetical protein